MTGSTSGINYRRIVLDGKRTLVIAIPLIGAQLLQMGNGLVDAAVAGRLGRAEFAAGGIGSGIWFFNSIMCIGLMAGLSPALSRLLGQGRRAAVGKMFRQGLWLAVMIGILALACCILMAVTLPHWSLEPELVPLIQQYLLTACWSIPAFAIVMACRNACEATGVTGPVLMVQAVGLVVNLLGNLAFGLGWFGFPKLGLVGIGLSTTIVMLTMAALLLLYLRRDLFKRYQFLAEFDKPDWLQLKPMLFLALPIYFALLFEVGLFFATAIQMGWIGTLAAGGHYIAISVSGACYMLPLGLSLAATARIGRAYGRESVEAVKLRMVSGLAIALLMAMTTAALLILFRYPITALYTDDIEVRKVAAHLLLFAAVFQIPDAGQVVLFGLLRGVHDTRIPMFINLFAYWGVALLVGYYFAHQLGFAADGLWGGLILGLTVASVLLGVRLWFRVGEMEVAALRQG